MDINYECKSLQKNDLIGEIIHLAPMPFTKIYLLIVQINRKLLFKSATVADLARWVIVVMVYWFSVNWTRPWSTNC